MKTTEISQVASVSAPETSVSAKDHVDGTLTGLSGELFVAAELSKRGFQVLITFGNPKEIDLIAHNFETKQKFAVQVKTLRAKGHFPVRKLEDGQICVFVLLNEPDESVQYFIARAEDLKNNHDLQHPEFQGIDWKALAGFKEAWHTFDC